MCHLCARLSGHLLLIRRQVYLWLESIQFKPRPFNHSPEIGPLTPRGLHMAMGQGSVFIIIPSKIFLPDPDAEKDTSFQIR